LRLQPLGVIMKREDLISECKRRSADGADMESIIRFLRMSGCSKIETIAVLLKTFDIDPAAAKKVVHFSPTWDDTRASDEKFHEMAVDATRSVDREG